MPRILMTGAAAGGVGTCLRKLLPQIYPDLLLSDLNAPADLGKDEKFKAADLADMAQVEATARASTASCISAAIRSKAPGIRSCSPTSSAATICSRQRGKRA